MIRDARADHRKQPSGVERKEPHRPAAIRTNNVSANICFREMWDSTEIMDLEWNQADVGRAVEGIQLEVWREQTRDYRRFIAPVQKSKTPPRLAHSHALNQLRRPSSDGLCFNPAYRNRLRPAIQCGARRPSPLLIALFRGSR